MMARDVIVSDALFGQWREAEFGWSNRTALRFMEAYLLFGVRMDNLSMQPSAMYALSGVWWLHAKFWHATLRQVRTIGCLVVTQTICLSSYSHPPCTR